MIKSLIDIELGYINTNHPDFISDTQLLLQESEHTDEDGEESKEEEEEEISINKPQKEEP
jgi:hypothetical protein